MSRNTTRTSILTSAIVAVLVANSTAVANEAADCEVHDTRSHCQPSTYGESEDGGSQKWLIGGLVAAGVAVALAGGGGGGGNGSGGGGSGDGGPLPGPGEGGAFGDNGILIGAGAQAVWGQSASSQVIGNNVRNDGNLEIRTGTLNIRGEGDLRNNGILTAASGASLVVEGEGELNNYGTLNVGGRLSLSGDGSVDNYGTMEAYGATVSLIGEADIENTGTIRLTNGTVTMAGDSDFDNGVRGASRGQLLLDGAALALRDTAEFDNSGDIFATDTPQGAALFDIETRRLQGSERIEAFDNRGSIRMEGGATVLSMTANTHDSVGVNRAQGRIDSQAADAAMIRIAGSRATFVNQGVLTVTGNGAVAMDGHQNATLINDGVINLGEQGQATASGQVAMRSDGSAVLNNRANGVINIHSGSSHAFQVTGSGAGRIINNGRVNVFGAASGIYADSATEGEAQPGVDLPYASPRSVVAGYTVGTNADGSAGQMVLTNGGELVDVDVDTGFTRGTSDQIVHLDDVFVGATGGEASIRSKSVVWSAKAERDEVGNTDVTMSRNDYASLVEDRLQGVAGALDRSYTNGEVFRSLELGSVEELNDALKQLSGEGLSAAAPRAVGSSRAFWTAMDAQRPAHGLLVVGFSDGTRQGWGPQGDGTAVTLVTPGSDGLTTRDVQLGVLQSSYSPGSDAADDAMKSSFFGVGWTRAVGAFQLRHAINNDWHALDTRRSVDYGGLTRQARSERTITRNVLNSTLSRSWQFGGMQLKPHVAASAYRHNEGAFRETGAGEFNLAISGITTLGANIETGLGWQWELNAHWRLSGDAAVIAPVVHSASERSARLGETNPVDFSLRGLEPEGLDHRLGLGVDYARGASRLNFGMHSQKFLGQRDERVGMSLGYWF